MVGPNVFSPHVAAFWGSSEVRQISLPLSVVGLHVADALLHGLLQRRKLRLLGADLAAGGVLPAGKE